MNTGIENDNFDLATDRGNRFDRIDTIRNDRSITTSGRAGGSIKAADCCLSLFMRTTQTSSNLLHDAIAGVK